MDWGLKGLSMSLHFNDISDQIAENLESLYEKISDIWKILYNMVLGCICFSLQCTDSIKFLVKLVNRMRGWIFKTLNTFKIEYVLEKTCSMVVFLVISDRKSQTGWILGQLKNLWVDFWEGCLHSAHLEASFIFHWKSLLFVMQVFLNILYCRSFASGIFEVLASFDICFPISSSGML